MEKSTGLGLDWSAQLTVIVIITVLLFIILILATLIICCWRCLTTERSDPYADSLSNLQYLNQAYEDDKDPHSRASHHFIRRQNRQSVSNGTTVTTGYIIADNDSRANSRSELVSITDSMSDDYRLQETSGSPNPASSSPNERHAHFSSRTETINDHNHLANTNGNVGTGNGVVANGNGTVGNGRVSNGGVSTISSTPQPPSPPPPQPPTTQTPSNGRVVIINGKNSSRREFIPMN